MWPKASCESTCRELSFEWSHHRISSTDSKVRVTLQNSIKHSGSERVNSFKSSSRVLFLIILTSVSETGIAQVSDHSTKPTEQCFSCGAVSMLYKVVLIIGSVNKHTATCTYNLFDVPIQY